MASEVISEEISSQGAIMPPHWLYTMLGAVDFKVPVQLQRKLEIK